MNFKTEIVEIFINTKRRECFALCVYLFACWIQDGGWRQVIIEQLRLRIQGYPSPLVYPIPPAYR